MDIPPDIPPDLLHAAQGGHPSADDDVRAPMAAKFDTLYGSRDSRMLAVTQAAQYGLNQVHRQEPEVTPLAWLAFSG